MLGLNVPKDLADKLNRALVALETIASLVSAVVDSAYEVDREASREAQRLVLRRRDS